MSPELRAARVRVPSSTSNLGAGFDTVGIALDRYLEASFEPGEGELVVKRTGTLTQLVAERAPDLVAEMFTHSLRSHGARATGSLTLSSTIPVARGLGSSAAAVVAGLDLALSALGRSRADEEVFRAAHEREGHGDNAAPCLFGGLQASAHGRDGPRHMGLELSPGVGFAYAAPSTGLSTEASRSVLAQEVSLASAVRQLGRIISLVHGLAVADPELIRIGVEDELHVPYRLPLIERGAAAAAAGYDAGAWAVTISGAGSGLIAMCAPSQAEEVSAAMRTVFSGEGLDEAAIGFALRPDFEGLLRR